MSRTRPNACAPGPQGSQRYECFKNCATQKRLRKQWQDCTPTDNLACYALSQRPTGCRLSTWSQTTFRTAVMGIARISPIAPHIQPQNRSEIVSASAFKRTRQPTSAGINRLAVTIWKKVSIAKIPTKGPTGWYCLSPTSSGGTQDIMTPRKG